MFYTNLLERTQIWNVLYQSEKNARKRKGWNPKHSFSLIRWLSGEEPTYQGKIYGFDPWVGKIP